MLGLQFLLLLPAYHRSPPPRMRIIAPMAVPAHEEFLSSTALTVPPPGLASVVGVLVASGEELVAPRAEPSLHPLVVPLTRDADGEVTGLLRWPAAGGGGSKLPLVRTQGRQLVLLADSTERYLARAAAVADHTGADDAEALAALAGAVGMPYTPGSAAASPGGLPGYVLTKVGPFNAEYEALANGHLAKGAETAALIACERAEGCFLAWGRPSAFHARMLVGLGRDEEARDKARAALDLPLWTLGAPLDEQILAWAQMPSKELLDKLHLKREGGLTARELQQRRGVDERTPQQIAKDRTSYLLDLAVAAPEEYSWASIRPELAELYREADMQSVAAFVLAPLEPA